MQKPHTIFTAVAVVVALGLGIFTFLTLTGGYRVKIVVPSAAQLVAGSPVWVNGLPAGAVEELTVSDGKAVVDISLTSDFAPLREGTTSWIQWYSAVGERIMSLTPGPPENAAIPDGALYAPPATRQIEVDQIFAVLDPETRQQLNGLFTQLDGTLVGREEQIRQTLTTAGPTVNALGAVLESVGRDGEAIKDLVAQLNQVTAIAAEHRDEVAGSVRNLAAFSGVLAEQQAQISEALREAPATLDVARATLADVPPAVEATVPLLNDLEPATSRLPSLSRNLSAVLQDLRPAVDDLRPTLDSLSELLDRTPDLLDTTHEFLPELQRTTEIYPPAVSFLRPYTPELIGWLHNFGQGFSHFDAQGHVWTAIFAPGANQFAEAPANPPTSNPVKEPAPGQAVGQPWTDAWGSERN